MTTNELGIVLLWCQHKLTFKADHMPALGDWLYCPRCQAMRSVEEAPPQYRIRCRRCTYSRRLGSSRADAEHAASAHRRKNAGHKVAVYNGRKLIYTLGLQDGQQLALQFPLEDPTPPPF